MLQAFINGDAFEFDNSIQAIIEGLNYQKVIQPQNLSSKTNQEKETIREFLTEAFLRTAIIIDNSQLDIKADQA